MTGESLEQFDFLTSDNTIEEVRKILCSERVHQRSLNFSLALTINFIKFDADGEILAKASPCFLSPVEYLNNVSELTRMNYYTLHLCEFNTAMMILLAKGVGGQLKDLCFVTYI